MTRCTRCSSERSELTVFCSHCGFPHEPKFDQLLNTILSGRYLLHDRLGEGGLSTVFLATDTHTEQEVVIKISDPRQIAQQAQHGSFDPTTLRRYWAEMIERMRREVIALVSVQHPHIVRILDTDRITDELRYIVMERLHGRTLREELSARGRFSLREAIQIAEAICNGLSAVHQRGIIHRDLNPRNLFIADCALRTADYAHPGLTLSFDHEPSHSEKTNFIDESQSAIRNPQSAVCTPQSAIIKIIDFGIARFPQPPGAPPFTQYAVLSGTVSYASPEQCQNQPLDHRSDIYSLGVVLYEMLTGQRPFTGLSPTEVAVRQIRDDPVNPRLFVPDLPTQVEATLLRSLAKDPDKRQQSAEELAAELRPYRQGVSARVVVPFNAADRPVSELASILSELNISTESSGIAELKKAPVEFSPPTNVDASVRTTTEPQAVSDEFVTRLPEPEFKTFEARPRRAVAAIAAALALLLLIGFLFGENWLNAWRAQMDASSPQIASNEIASLPLAEKPVPRGLAETARTAAQRFGNSLLNSVRRIVPQSSGSDSDNNSATNNADREGIIGAAASASVSTPPPSKPQMPPAPAPTIAASREVPPASNPSISHGPMREPDVQPVIQSPPNEAPAIPAQRERQVYSPPESQSASRPTETSPDDPRNDTSDRNPIQSDPRSSRKDEGSIRRAPEQTELPRDEEDRNNRQPRLDDSPKVITWSGIVHEEREIRLELPGTPGNINIPRAYRKRVGLVEPPGPQNGWRSVVLRVFGKGHTSIVVQWWPRSMQFSRSAGDFFNRRVINPVNQASRAVARQFSRIR